MDLEYCIRLVECFWLLLNSNFPRMIFKIKANKFFVSKASFLMLFLKKKKKLHVWLKNPQEFSPDNTKRFADGEERENNRQCFGIDEILDTASTSSLYLVLIVIPEILSDDSDADENWGQEVGQLEVELKPGLAGCLDGAGQAGKHCYKM